MDATDEVPVAEFLTWIREYHEVLNQMPNNGNMTTTDSFSKAGEILTCSLDSFHTHKNNKTLVRVLTTTDCVPADEAKNCVEKFVQKCPAMATKAPELITLASTPQVADEALTNSIKTSVQKTANKTLMTSSAAAFVCVIVEARSLIGFWKEVRDIKEFSSDNLVELKEDIAENVEKISVEIIKLVEEMNEHNFENMSGEERYWFYSRKARRLDIIRKKIDTAFTDIGNLRAEINGRIERLSTITETANSSAVLQGVQGVRQSGMTILNRRTANQWALVASGMTAIMHFAASISNVFLARDCQDTIKQLRAKLSEIRKMKKKLDDMQDEVENHFEDFAETICPRNQHITLEQICAA